MADEDDVDQMMDQFESEDFLDPYNGDEWMTDDDDPEQDSFSTSGADDHQDEEMALDANYDGASDLRNPFNMSTIREALDEDDDGGW